jgi:hypothetical protein
MAFVPLMAVPSPTWGNRTNHTTMPHRPSSIPPVILHPFYGRPALKPPHSLQSRDSITIEISSSFSNTTVSNTQNNARFQVINNAKNSAIAVGDDATHNVTFDSFGDKNMINSTGSATGGWNTKNHETNISTEPHKRSVSWTETQTEEKRDLVNLNVLNGKVKGSNLTRSGNGNTVELHIAGNGDNVVNVTITWEGEDSDMADSMTGNTVKVYIGDMEANGDMGNNTVVIV